MIDIVVPISGGKDSQACLKLAVENYDRGRVLGLFCDTGFEHPITYQHISGLADLYGVQIKTLKNGTVEDQCIKHGRFPSGVARFCTEELKIWPSRRFYAELANDQGRGFEVWYGVRQDESPERKKRYAGKVCDEVYAPNEFMKKYPKRLEKQGVMFRLPIVEWCRDDVFEFLDGKENPLYAAGFDRVGCFPCLAGGDGWKEIAFSHDDFGRQQKAKVDAVAVVIGKSVWTSKGGKARNEPGCSLCAM